VPLSGIDGMSHLEFTLWMTRGPLWPRRLELLLIQLTNTLAQVNGNKTNMSDFDMFNKTRAAELNEAAQTIGSIAGAGVRKLGQGRKNG